MLEYSIGRDRLCDILPLVLEIRKIHKKDIKGLHRQDATQTGGRGEEGKVPAATVAMEQQQIRLDTIGSVAAGICFGARSNALSTHRTSYQDI